MKKTLILLTVFLCQLGNAQVTNTIEVQWKTDNFINFDSHKIKIPQFQLNNFSFDETSKEIFFHQKIKVDGQINENSVRILNVTYESISASDLGELNIQKIPNEHNFEIKNSIS